MAAPPPVKLSPHVAKVDEGRPSPRPQDEDDVAIVLEAIDFMLTLQSLKPDRRRELARVKALVESRTDD